MAQATASKKAQVQASQVQVTEGQKVAEVEYKVTKLPSQLVTGHAEASLTRNKPSKPASKAQPKAKAASQPKEAKVKELPKVWCWISAQAIDEIRKAHWLGFAEADYRCETRNGGGGSFLNPTPAQLDKLEAFANEQLAKPENQKGSGKSVYKRLAEQACKARADMIKVGRFPAA